MLIIAILFSLFFATLITAVFYFLIEKPWKEWWIFFLIIFLIYFSATRWLVPAGPAVYGHYWLPAFIVAVIVAILMAALYSMANKKERREKTSKEVYSGDESEEGIVLGAFFWIFLLLILITAVVSAVY
jgi:drug/metabolite transporter (DMT)-like permease